LLLKLRDFKSDYRLTKEVYNLQACSVTKIYKMKDSVLKQLVCMCLLK